MGLVADFETVIRVGEELEGHVLPDRLRRRIANAYERAIEKALGIAWQELLHTAQTDVTLFRHAERGIRDFVP